MKNIYVKVEIKIPVNDTDLDNIENIVAEIENNFKNFIEHCPFENTSIKTILEKN